jgi:hypothetical protein
MNNVLVTRKNKARASREETTMTKSDQYQSTDVLLELMSVMETKQLNQAQTLAIAFSLCRYVIKTCDIPEDYSDKLHEFLKDILANFDKMPPIKDGQHRTWLKWNGASMTKSRKQVGVYLVVRRVDEAAVRVITDSRPAVEIDWSNGDSDKCYNE